MSRALALAIALGAALPGWAAGAGQAPVSGGPRTLSVLFTGDVGGKIAPCG